MSWLSSLALLGVLGDSFDSFSSPWLYPSTLTSFLFTSFDVVVAGTREATSHISFNWNSTWLLGGSSELGRGNWDYNTIEPLLELFLLLTLCFVRYDWISWSPLIFATSRNLVFNCVFSFSKSSILFCKVSNCFCASSSFPLVSRNFLYANSNAWPIVRVISSAWNEGNIKA